MLGSDRSDATSRGKCMNKLASPNLHGAERAVQNVFRSPGFEATSLDETSLRECDARVNTSFQYDLGNSPGAHVAPQ